MKTDKMLLNKIAPITGLNYCKDGFKITIGTAKDTIKNPLVNHDYTVCIIDDNSLQAESNAAFIVTAVNNHYKLIAALKQCIGEFNCYDLQKETYQVKEKAANLIAEIEKQ